ncbi:hypothetical protein Scep_009829 [Stephania cephalantha]|uniref:Uncharacterized protein n=1 Tax=Stephania cephalantha TaxID=152367 RepID=A0AAP0JVB1_9MAGN
MCSYSRLYTGVPYRDLSTPLGPLGPRHHHTSRSCEADTIAHPDKNFSQLHKKHKKSAKLPQGRLHLAPKHYNPPLYSGNNFGFEEITKPYVDKQIIIFTVFHN